MRAAAMKFNLLGLVLLLLSGATPAPCEVSGWDRDEGVLAHGSCPTGSCEVRG